MKKTWHSVWKIEHSPAGHLSPCEREGFTLVELLVASTLLISLVALLAIIMGNTSNMWIRHRGKATSFESASVTFDALTHSLAQATLNTYWGYDNQASPTRYVRLSDLHFDMGPAATLFSQGNAALYPGAAVFFQAPLGWTTSGLRVLPSVLNAVGYFTYFSAPTNIPQFLVTNQKNENRWRYRLYEWLQPSENFTVYSDPSLAAGGDFTTWFQADASAVNTNSVVIAENVIGLVLMAEYPSAPGASPSPSPTQTYAYDSRDSTNAATLNQLSPKIRVLMVAIDEASAERLAAVYGQTPPPIGPSGNDSQNPRFVNVNNFNTDLQSWKNQLETMTPHVEFTVFTATVTIQNAKWSL